MVSWTSSCPACLTLSDSVISGDFHISATKMVEVSISVILKYMYNIVGDFFVIMKFFQRGVQIFSVTTHYALFLDV